MFFCLQKFQVGIAACQIGRSLGLTVYGTAGTSEGMELVRQNGAHLVFNHKEKGYQEKIMVSITVMGAVLLLQSDHKPTS